jgi:Metallopeptidase family M24
MCVLPQQSTSMHIYVKDFYVARQTVSTRRCMVSGNSHRTGLWHCHPLSNRVHNRTRAERLQGIAKMRRVSKLAASILRHAGTLCKPGVTTEEIDQQVHAMAVKYNAYPSPLYYGDPIPFPKSVCTSVNECVCHGIPDKRALRDGDIVNVDVTVWLDGYHGDTSRCGSSFIEDGGRSASRSCAHERSLKM